MNWHTIEGNESSFISISPIHNTKHSTFQEKIFITVEIHRLDQWILDLTSTVAGKADMCQLSVSFTCNSIGPIDEF